MAWWIAPTFFVAVMNSFSDDRWNDASYVVRETIVKNKCKKYGSKAVYQRTEKGLSLKEPLSNTNCLLAAGPLHITQQFILLLMQVIWVYGSYQNLFLFGLLTAFNIEATPIFLKVCAPSSFSFHPAPVLCVSEYPSRSRLQCSVPFLSDFCALVSKAFSLAPLTALFHSCSQPWAALQVSLALPTSPGPGWVPDHCLDALCSLGVSRLDSWPVWVVAWWAQNKLTWTRV